MHRADSRRRKRNVQISLVLVAVVAAVLLSCDRFNVASALYAILYGLLVIAPQLIAIVIQLRFVKCSIIEYTEALNEWKQYKIDRLESHSRVTIVVDIVLHTITELKTMGINPNRAGPIGAFA